MADTVYKCADCGAFFYTLPAVAAHDCCQRNVETQSTEPHSSVSVETQSTVTEPALSVSGETLSTELPSSQPNISTSAVGRPVTVSLWSPEKTKVLLDNYKANREKLESQLYKKKRVWQEITEQVNTETNSNFTPMQVEGRWKTVLAAYRKYKDSQNKTGAGRTNFDYLTEMDDIMGECHSTVPAYLFSSQSSGAEANKQTANNKRTNEESDEETPTGKPENKLKRCSESGASKMISFLQTFTENAAQREAAAAQRADERHNENVTVLKSLVDVLKGFSKTK